MSTLPVLPSQRRLYRAFLSHAHVDKGIVEQLHSWLEEKAKLPVWYDSYNLSASATISTDLARAISQCRNMIIVLSKASVKSGWVEEEYNAAIGQRAKYKQYRIVPIRIEECEIPGFLQTTKWIDIADQKIDLRTAYELITGLYYDDKALRLENIWDIYVSRSWRPKESPVPDYVCQMLDKAGFRLIGDSEDQPKYDPTRVQSIIASCGGLVAILPNRDQGTTSRYIIDEIKLAQAMGLYCLIITEPGVSLPEDLNQSTIRISVNDIGKSEPDIILQEGIEILADKWQQPSQPHYIFLATDLDTKNEQRNQIIKNAIQHITAMPCVIGDKISESQIREIITQQISQAFFVIADISENNINSCIEAGIAIGAKRPLRLVSHIPRGKVPFMLNNYQVFNYTDDVELLGIIHRITFPFRRRVLNSELPR
jgi:TIR domain